MKDSAIAFSRAGIVLIDGFEKQTPMLIIMAT